MAVRNRVCGPTRCGITALTPRCTKGGCKLDDGQRMPGAENPIRLDDVMESPKLVE